MNYNLDDALLTLEQVTARITVLALNASRNPEQSPRVRMLLGDLLADIQDCERELGTYVPIPQVLEVLTRFQYPSCSYSS